MPTYKQWAVVQFKHLAGEWTGTVRFMHRLKPRAVEKWAEISREEGLGPTELVVRKVVVEQVPTPVSEALLLAENVTQVRDILAEARLTYHEASPATKRKWERLALAREMALNRAEAGSRVVAFDESKLIIGGPALLDAQGRPVKA